MLCHCSLSTVPYCCLQDVRITSHRKAVPLNHLIAEGIGILIHEGMLVLRCGIVSSEEGRSVIVSLFHWNKCQTCCLSQREKLNESFPLLRRMHFLWADGALIDLSQCVQQVELVGKSQRDSSCPCTAPSLLRFTARPLVCWIFLGRIYIKFSDLLLNLTEHLTIIHNI